MGHSLKNKRILITCGPTWVPIDAVRVVSNISSGVLGQRIALDCARAGAKVTLLEGPVATPLLSRSLRIVKFRFFEELQRLLKQELRADLDAVVHAAAVADYRLKRPIRGKLSSHEKRLKLEFIATPKLIDAIKRRQPKTFLVGFKLEPAVSPSSAFSKARDLFGRAGCDVVVVNQLTPAGYKGYIVNKENHRLAQAAGRPALSKALVRILGENL